MLVLHKFKRFLEFGQPLQVLMICQKKLSARVKFGIGVKLIFWIFVHQQAFMTDLKFGCSEVTGKKKE